MVVIGQASEAFGEVGGCSGVVEDGKGWEDRRRGLGIVAGVAKDGCGGGVVEGEVAT